MAKPDPEATWPPQRPVRRSRRRGPTGGMGRTGPTSSLKMNDRVDRERGRDAGRGPVDHVVHPESARGKVGHDVAPHPESQSSPGNGTSTARRPPTAVHRPRQAFGRRGFSSPASRCVPTPARAHRRRPGRCGWPARGWPRRARTKRCLHPPRVLAPERRRAPRARSKRAHRTPIPSLPPTAGDGAMPAETTAPTLPSTATRVSRTGAGTSGTSGGDSARVAIGAGGAAGGAASGWGAELRHAAPGCVDRSRSRWRVPPRRRARDNPPGCGACACRGPRRARRRGSRSQRTHPSARR